MAALTPSYPPKRVPSSKGGSGVGRCPPTKALLRPYRSPIRALTLNVCPVLGLQPRPIACNHAAAYMRGMPRTNRPRRAAYTVALEAITEVMTDRNPYEDNPARVAKLVLAAILNAACRSTGNAPTRSPLLSSEKGTRFRFRDLRYSRAEKSSCA